MNEKHVFLPLGRGWLTCLTCPEVVSAGVRAIIGDPNLSIRLRLSIHVFRTFWIGQYPTFLKVHGVFLLRPFSPAFDKEDKM
jgi:hypothetical protein